MSFSGTRPTALNMKLKFPEFVSYNDAAIEFAIEEAMLFVDDTWIIAHETVAVMYLAAHYLMVSILRGQQTSGTMEGGQRVTSESFGGMSISYENDSIKLTADSKDFTTTVYGLRYYDFLKMSHVGVAVV